MNTSRGFSSVLLLLAGVLALAVIAVGTYYVSTKRAADVPTQTATTTESSAQTSNLETYTSSDYGITFQYPNTFSVVDTSHVSGGSERTIAWFATNNDVGPQVESFYVGFWDGAVNPGIVDTCTTPPSAPGAGSYTASDIGTTTINGVAYLSYVSSSAKLGSASRFFETARNGKCFDIHLNYPLPPDPKAVAQLEAIIESLRFE